MSLGLNRLPESCGVAEVVTSYPHDIYVVESPIITTIAIFPHFPIREIDYIKKVSPVIIFFVPNDIIR